MKRSLVFLILSSVFLLLILAAPAALAVSPSVTTEWITAWDRPGSLPELKGAVISGQVVVGRCGGNGYYWPQEPGDPASGLYAFDLVSRQSILIARDPVQDVSLSFDWISGWDVFGDTVVWSEDSGSGYDIWSYDLATNAKSLICGSSGDQLNPKISSDLIVWADNRSAATKTKTGPPSTASAWCGTTTAAAPTATSTATTSRRPQSSSSPPV